MDCVDSSWNSGKRLSTEDILDNRGRPNYALFNKDNFQCTFFRQPKSKFVTKNVAPWPSPENSIVYNLSDTCTDTESECDEPVNVTATCLQTDAGQDQILQTDEPPPRSLKVTFDQIVHVHSDKGTKPCVNKRPVKIQVCDDVTKDACKKRNCSVQKTDRNCRLQQVRFSMPRFPKKYENPITLKDRIFFKERLENYRSMHPAMRGILRGIKRPNEPVNHVRNDEFANKRRKLVEMRISKNKQLLKSMKDVIKEIDGEESPFQLGLSSLQSIKPSSKTAEVNITKLEKDNEEEQKPKKIPCKRAADPEIRRPVFKKPELEMLLNKSMEEAMEKYKRCRITWDDMKKGKSINT